MSRVEIVIDELVVRGLPPEVARLAARELERYLADLAAAPGPEIAAREEAFRRLPVLDSPAESLGRSVAAAVWESLTGAVRR